MLLPLGTVILHLYQFVISPSSAICIELKCKSSSLRTQFNTNKDQHHIQFIHSLPEAVDDAG